MPVRVVDVSVEFLKDRQLHLGRDASVILCTHSKSQLSMAIKTKSVDELDTPPHKTALQNHGSKMEAKTIPKASRPFQNAAKPKGRANFETRRKKQ